jgi:ribose transport system substrate-binding protein
MKLIPSPQVLAVLCVIALFDSGCSKSPQTETTSTNATQSTEKKLTIACVPKATTHSYWKAAEAGARKAGKELGVNIEWQGPLDDSKIADQIGIFNNLAASGVDGILLSPCDDKALAPHVRTVSKRGIPVAIFDSPLDGKQGVDFTNFVATDNKNAGVVAATQLASLLGDTLHYGGKVLMIRFTEGSASTRLREEGFTESVGKNGKLQIAAQQFTDGSMAGAQRVAETLLNSAVANNKLELDGVFASNQPTAEGTYNALKSLRDKGVEISAKFVGFDSSDLLTQGLQTGVVDALVVQDPEKMGYLGVKSLVDAIHKKPVTAYVDTGVTVKTKDSEKKP